jgi:type II secretory pathway component PulC
VCSSDLSALVNATTTYTPPQTYIFYKPETGLLIRAFQTKPDAIYTFDAAFLRKSLVGKYGLHDVVSVASPREFSTPQISAPTQERPLLVVKGIVYSESNPSALVGKLIPPGVVGDVQSVHKGDMVAGAKITRITKDAVEFEMNGQIWRQNVER